MVPAAIVLLLGTCYAFSNIFYWSNITKIADDASLLTVASAIVSSFVNVLPAIVPVLIAYLMAGGPENGRGELLVLMALALLTSVCAVQAAFSANSEGSSSSSRTSLLQRYRWQAVRQPPSTSISPSISISMSMSSSTSIRTQGGYRAVPAVSQDEELDL